MEYIAQINKLLALAFTLCYLYQVFYILVPLLKRDKPLSLPAKEHKYAVLIAARNEESVIAQLLDSITMQTYQIGRAHV